MNSIVETSLRIYKPEFDSGNGSYYDKNPCKPYERNPTTYRCRCKHGSIFRTATQFKQHTKTKVHQDFVREYGEYFKESDESREIIKTLRKQTERLQRKLQKTETQLFQQINLNKDLSDRLKVRNDGEESEDEFHDC